jgi:hypothetical protein
MCPARVTFAEVISVFLSSFHGELTNDSKTSGTEADLWMADIRRRRPPPKARQVLQLQGWLKEQVATEHLWASLQTHRVMG